ncbi:MAG: aldo/keto reductase [Chthoniobacter sp.]|jgi:aryl-alcohol dehydrogenase-like predicted oxidoreductase|nr:aldo/keto reductase [Chthoniobacter sp.]
MDLTRTAYGTWSGGRFMHFGEPLDDDRFIGAIRLAYESGVRTFMTADVYGNGAADEMLGRALAGFRRDSYCLVGAIGHDFYSGQRDGSKGFPRFTHAQLRRSGDYASYIRMATEKALARCGTDHFDCVLLHNPDHTGYTSDAVWNGMEKLREAKLTELLGIAPGPANGFALDLILSFERFGALMDWAMIILNPLEPWPGSLCLPAAEQHNVKLITRVADYGGVFHDDVKPGHTFGQRDHRTFRPAGWVEAAHAKMERLRPFAKDHGLTMLQLSLVWNLSHAPVKSVIPTMIQEVGSGAKPIEAKIEELASLPELTLSRDEVEEIRRIGDNTGCMDLKGGNPRHIGETLPDRWALTNDLLQVAERWRISPAKDLAYAHAEPTSPAAAR